MKSAKLPRLPTAGDLSDLSYDTHIQKRKMTEDQRVAKADSVLNQAIVKPRMSWTNVAKIAVAVGVTGGGLLLHFIGATSHRVYLEALRLDPGLFPKSTDSIVIGGYYALIDRVAVILGQLATSFVPILVAILALAAYISGTRALGKFAERKTSGKKQPAWLKGWLGDLFGSALISCLLYVTVPLALILLMLLMIPPAALAESAGLESARRDLALFKNGCAKAKSTVGCMELRKGAESIAHGFLIDSTESHIALFDVREQRVRAFEREGTEVVGDYPSLLDLATSASKR